MQKPNLNKIIKDNLDKTKFQSKKTPTMSTNGWLDSYQSGGIYLSDRAKATQFGQYKTGGQGCPDGYINIDGDCIKKNSLEYREMLNKGLVGTMEGDRFWGNKATLQPVTVVSSRDKDTQAFYDKLRKGNLDKYNALVNLGLKYGFPHVSLKEKAEAFDFLDPNAFNTEEENQEGYYRAHYSPIQQRMYLSANQSPRELRNKYIAELAHHKQLMDKGSLDFNLRGLKGFGRVLANSIKNLESPVDAYDREYDLPGTIEYQAHQEIEPKLTDEYHDLLNKQLRESRYYELPGFFQASKPTQTYKRGGGYFPEYKSFAPPRMNVGGEPCYDAQGNKIPCPEEQARLNKQKAIEDTTKSFLENWYNSPMHREMLKSSLNRGLGLFLNKRADKMTQDRLKTVPDIKVNIDKLPEGTFDISDTSLQGFVNKDNPSLINISAFSSLEDAKGTGVHEGSHLADYAAGIPIKDVKRMRRAASAPTDEYGAYIIGDESGTEPKGRVYNGRYELLKAGIYNPFKEKLSRENFERGEREVPEFKRINDELRSIYSTDDIFNFYNTISKSNNTQPQTMAKYGSSVQSKEGLPKYQSIGEVTGKNCVGQCWKPTLSDKSGNSGGMFVGNTPISWKELLKYTDVDTKDKQFKKYLKDLQSRFPGLTQDQFLAARNDSFRIKGRIEDLPTWDKPENQTYDRAWYPFYRPLMQPNVRVTVPQILEFQSQQPGGLGGYQQVVESNYGKKKFTNGGLTKYQIRGQVSQADSVKHLAGQMMDYEARKGSPTGTGLSDWGYHSSQLPYNKVPSTWHAPQTREQAVDLYMQEIATNPILGYFPTAMEKGEAGDFLYNTGRDPRVYMLDQYLRSKGQSGLPNRGSYNVDTKTPKWTPELQTSLDEVWNQYAPEITKLPVNQRRILLNKGRDFYYQNINQVNGKPNPAYEATWKPRIWESVNTYKQEGGDISIPDLNTDKWLTKYQSKGQVSFSLPDPRDLQRQMMGSNESTSLGTKIDEPALRLASINRQKRKQGEIRQAGPERSAASKAWAIATHPMTALAYKVKGQDIPENFEKGERNALDYAVDVINPATYLGAAGRTADNITSPKKMFYRALNSIEGDDNMLDVIGDALVTASIPGLAKSTLNTLDKQFSNVGRQLEKIRFEGEARGLNPHEIADLQMKKVGITSNQRQAYLPGVSELINKYVTPVGYQGSFENSKLSQILDNIKKGGHNTGNNNPHRQDAWNLYLGIPQTNKTFRLSNTSPALHPLYKPGSLKGMDIYNIRYMDDYNPRAYYDYDRGTHLKDLQKAVTFDRESGYGVMGGYNKRITKQGTQYNDVWDLEPTVSLKSFFPKKITDNPALENIFYKKKIVSGVETGVPRAIKVPVDKFIGKPFMSHGNTSFTTYDYLKELESQIGHKIKQLEPARNTAVQGEERLRKLQQDLEYIKNYKPKYEEGGLYEYGPGGQTTDGCKPYHSKNAKGECVPDWMNFSMPTNRTDAPITIQEKLRKEGEAEEFNRRNRATAKRQFVGPARLQTDDEKKINEQRKRNYTYTHPNAVYNEQTGSLETKNLDRDLEGRALPNTTAAGIDKGMEHFTNALEAAGYIQGAGALGKGLFNLLKKDAGEGAAKVAKNVYWNPQSSTYQSTPYYSNTTKKVYQLNLPDELPEEMFTVDPWIQKLVNHNSSGNQKIFQQAANVNQNINAGTDWLQNAGADIHGINIEDLIPGRELGSRISKGGAHNKGVFELKRFPNYVVKFEDPQAVVRTSGNFNYPNYDFVQGTQSIEYPNIAKVHRQIGDLPGIVDDLGQSRQGQRALIMNRVTGEPIHHLTPMQIRKMPDQVIQDMYANLKKLRNDKLGFDFFGENLVYNPSTKQFGMYDIDPAFVPTPNQSIGMLDWNGRILGGGNLEMFGVEESGKNLKEALKEKLLSGYRGAGNNFTINMKKFIPHGQNSRIDMLNAIRNKGAQQFEDRVNSILAGMDHYRRGGMITDPRGQWAHPGQNTRIPGSNITMQGVPYPVLAKASNGMTTIMYPGQEYSFPGAKHVDEYPMTGWLNKYQGGGTSYTVQPGDNLSKIGRRFGLSPQQIGLANNIQNLNRINVNQVLSIPTLASQPDSQQEDKLVTEETNLESPTAVKNVQAPVTQQRVVNTTQETPKKLQTQKPKLATEEPASSVLGDAPPLFKSVEERDAWRKRLKEVANKALSQQGDIQYLVPLTGILDESGNPISLESGENCISGICGLNKAAGLEYNAPTYMGRYIGNQTFYDNVNNKKEDYYRVNGNFQVGDHVQLQMYKTNKDGSLVYSKKTNKPVLKVHHSYEIFDVDGVDDQGNKLIRLIHNGGGTEFREKIITEQELKNWIAEQDPNESIGRYSAIVNRPGYSLDKELLKKEREAATSPEARAALEKKKQLIEYQTGHDPNYQYSIREDSPLFKNQPEGMKKFIQYANNTEKINELVKKLGVPKDVIHDELLNTFGELGEENKWNNPWVGGNIVPKVVGNTLSKFLPQVPLESAIEKIGSFLNVGKGLSVGPGQIKMETLNDEEKRAKETGVKSLKELFDIKSMSDLQDFDKVIPLMTAMNIRNRQWMERKGTDLSKYLIGKPGAAASDLKYGVGRWTPYMYRGSLSVPTTNEETKTLEEGSYADKVYHNIDQNLQRILPYNLEDGVYRDLQPVVITASSKKKQKFGGENNWLTKYQFAGGVGKPDFIPLLPNSPIIKWINHKPTTADLVASLADPTGLANTPFLSEAVREMVQNPSWNNFTNLGWNVLGQIPFGIGTEIRAIKNAEKIAKYRQLSNNVSKAQKVGRAVGNAIGTTLKTADKVVTAPARAVNAGWKAAGFTPVLNKTIMNADKWNRGMRGYELGFKGSVDALDYMFPGTPQKKNGGQTNNWLSKYK